MGLLVHLRSIVLSISFGILLYTLSRDITIMGVYGDYVIFFLLFILGIYSGRRIGRRALFAVIPAGLAVFSAGLLFFIDASSQAFGQRDLFVFFVTFLYYIALLGIVRLRDNQRDITAHSLFAISLMALLFFFYAVIYGIYINFEVSLWGFLFVQTVFIFSITATTLTLYVSNRRRVMLYSAVIAFVMSQFAWMVNFWPFGYLTIAAVNLMFYYILLDMTEMLFVDKLSKKRTVINIIFTLALLIMILSSTKWAILS